MLIGVGNADAFTGSDTTLTSGDVIVDGTVGDGDTLTLTGAAFATSIDSSNAAIANIENIVVNFDSLTASTFDGAGITGAVDVTVNQVRAGSSALVNVDNLDSDSVVNAGTGLTGGMAVAPGTVDANAIVNTGTATGTFDVDTAGTGTITTTGEDATLVLDSADGDITVTKTGTAGAVTADASGSGNVVITADATTAAVTGISDTGDVTVNADASTDVTATATAGTAIVDAAAATAIEATGSSVTVISGNVGTTSAATVIDVNGTAGASDSATVTANGVVTLTNNVDLEAITLSGNTQAATYTIGDAEAFTVTGDQNVTIAGSEADLSASTVADSSTGTLTINVTDPGTGADYSEVASDVFIHSDAVGAGTYTYADATNVTFAVDPAGDITLDIDDDVATTSLAGSLNVTLGADTTKILTVDSAGDQIDTLNVTSSVDQTALDIRADNTATTGDTIVLSGSADYTLDANNATALAVDASTATGIITATANSNVLSVTGGSAADVLTLAADANASIDGGEGNDNLNIGAGTLLSTNSITGGDGTDTLDVAGSADISDATLSGVEIIAQDNHTLTVNADQVNLQGMVFTGDGVVTVNNIGSSLSLENIVFSDPTAETVIDVAATNPDLGAGAARVITGSNVADAITGGNGNDVLSGGAGDDTLEGGTGADALLGGTGNNTYTYTAAGQAASGESIMFNTATGATETIAISDGAATAISVDLSEINGGVLLTGLDEITIGAADSATVLGSQVTGLEIDVAGVTNTTETLNVVGTANGDVIDLSDIGLTNAVLTVDAGAGDDAITANAGGGTFTGGAGADTITGGAGDDDIISYADVTASSSHSLTNLTGVAVNLSDTAVTSATVTSAMGGTVVLGGGDGVAGADLAAGTASYLTTNGTTSTTTMVRDTFTSVEGVIGSDLADYIVLGAGGMSANGGAGADIIDGGAGDDVITGGAGADVLFGGAGQDVFVFVTGDSSESASDTILDFTITNDDKTTDILDLDSASADHLADIIATDVSGATTEAADTVTLAASDGVLTAAGTDAANLDTVAEWYDAAAIIATAIGTAAFADIDGALAFEFGGDTYVLDFTWTNASTTLGLDNSVVLDGVTGVTDLDTTALNAAANTVIIA